MGSRTLVGIALMASVAAELAHVDEHEPLTEDTVASQSPEHHLALKHTEPDVEVALPPVQPAPPEPFAPMVFDSASDVARSRRQQEEHQNRVAHMTANDAGQVAALAHLQLAPFPFVDDGSELVLRQRREVMEQHRRRLARIMASDGWS